MQYSYESTENYGQDRLVVGVTQLVTETVLLQAGLYYRRGMLLGRVTGNNKLTLSTGSAGDGSQVPYGICIDDYDGTTADVIGGVYIKGDFSQLAVILGAGQTIAGVHDALRDAGIFLKSVVSA